MSLKVQVWLAELDRPDWPLADLVAALETTSGPGRTRVEGPRRRRFLVSRGVLRALDVDGRVVSSARSGALAVYALADYLHVGIDVEVVRPVAGLLDVARLILPAEVHAELAALPPDMRPRAFARWWTRAEACVKACRDGLEAAPRLQRTPTPDALVLPDPAGGPPVVSRDLAVGDGAAAALATDAASVRRRPPAYADSLPRAPHGRTPAGGASRPLGLAVGGVIPPRSGPIRFPAEE